MGVGEVSESAQTPRAVQAPSSESLSAPHGPYHRPLHELEASLAQVKGSTAQQANGESKVELNGTLAGREESIMFVASVSTDGTPRQDGCSTFSPEVRTDSSSQPHVSCGNVTLPSLRRR
jgi:hypothetical protein